MEAQICRVKFKTLKKIKKGVPIVWDFVAYGVATATNRLMKRYGLPTVSDEDVQWHEVLNGDKKETIMVDKDEREGVESGFMGTICKAMIFLT